MTGDSPVLLLLNLEPVVLITILYWEKERYHVFKWRKEWCWMSDISFWSFWNLHRKIFSWSPFKNSSSRILQMLPPKCLLKIKCLKYQILFLVYLPKKETFSTFLLFFASVTYLNNKINWTFWVPNEKPWQKFLN